MTIQIGTRVFLSVHAPGHPDVEGPLDVGAKGVGATIDPPLELGEPHFNRIQLWGVWWEVKEKGVPNFFKFLIHVYLGVVQDQNRSW